MVRIACHLWCYRQALGREGLSQRLDTVLRQVAAAGFPGVQHFLDSVQSDKDAADYAALLSKHGLRPAGLYASGPAHDDQQAPAFTQSVIKAVQIVQQHIDLRTLTLNPDALPDGAPKNDEQLERQADTLLHLSSRLAELGIRLVYHFRGPEMDNDAKEFKWMMRLVPSRHMSICFDADWAARAGQIPGDLLDQFAPRIAEMHLRSSRDGVWDEVLSDGDVRLRDLIELLDDYDFRGWHVVALSREDKTPRTISLPEALRRSYNYARSLLTAADAADRFRYWHS